MIKNIKDPTATVTLPQFLTEAQIAEAFRLYKICVSEAIDFSDAVAKIQAEVIEPNMAAINAKLGQENDARYLAYAVVHACSQAEERWS